MAAINPKLEFYRFTLDHKDDQNKTFRDFAIESLGASKTVSSENAFKACFASFMKNLNTGFEENDKLQKTITLISKRTVNKHLDKKPTPILSKNYFYGVINGGSYGKDRILSDLADKEQSESIGKQKPVLSYYFVFVYLPSDYNEGFFMVHSNNSDDTITKAVRTYISKLFKKGPYRKPVMELFCPENFQEEFRNGAILKNMTFRTSFAENIPQDDPIAQMFKSYNIKIEATPNNKDVPVSIVTSIKDYLETKLFGSVKSATKLSEFNKVTMSTANTETKSSKTFEWNSRDASFTPVVYLENLVKLNDDKTPDFDKLKDYCITLFENMILKEIRPDQNAKRID